MSSSGLLSPTLLRDRRSIPFAVAVDKWLGVGLSSDQDARMEGSEAYPEDSRAPQTFNVAVKSLLDEHFTLVGRNVMSQ